MIYPITKIKSSFALFAEFKFNLNISDDLAYNQDNTHFLLLNSRLL